MTQSWLRHSIGGFHLDIAWSLEPGQVHVLFGQSGSGKTTTLRAIAGLVRPDEGHIELDGQVVFDSAGSVWTPPHKRRVGYLPQEYHLFPHLDVAQNIAFGLSDTRDSMAQRVEELLTVFRLTGVAGRRVWELSGGQRQRVALGRAMAPNPSVLLLDEPFSALDMELRRELRAELRAVLARTNIPIVLVTHDREEAVALGDSIQILEQGRVVASGTPIEALGHPTQVRVARLVGIENIFTVTVRERDAEDGALRGTADSIPISLPFVDAEIGEELTVGVRAEDIILASEEPSGLSARNNLPGKVVSVHQEGARYEVVLDCGIVLRSAVTRSAITSLSIQPGQTLWAVLKASSFLILAEQLA
ncbi:MAG: molybdenum ABC transporter ATP-binding protein [Chloroflexi bacterium]|nr:molybdenum ABC transporter ATP-binding protein [Chloroflexota bacterium]